jgi:predicted transcriptional regulator
LKSGGDQHISTLAKKSSMSYVHALGMLKKLEEKGLVTTELKGNKRIVKLTEPGISFVLSLEELIKKAPAKRA